MLAPFGTLLIHTSLPGDDIEDSSHNNTLHGLAQDADSSDANAPPTDNGICELEDAATSLDWAPEQHTFSNVVTVDDNAGMLNKSCALSLLFKYSKSMSSADRLRRVQQQACFLQSEPNMLPNDSSEELGDILIVTTHLQDPYSSVMTTSVRSN
jgi:hypothetical protein